MAMQGTPCTVACDQTYTEKARISYDAMSWRSCQAQRSANPASGLHCATKNDLWRSVGGKRVRRRFLLDITTHS
jgi:hypothetical protein